MYIYIKKIIKTGGPLGTDYMVDYFLIYYLRKTLRTLRTVVSMEVII